MKKVFVTVSLLILTALLLTGCSINVNMNKKIPDIEETLANSVLIPDPVKYDPEGAYTVTFRFEKGGFEKMDLSQAYVAYYPFTVIDQIDAITSGDDSEEIPPLPSDAQDALDEVVGEDQLEKIAVITVETADDRTLKVSFADKDNPVKGKEYYFIIPNEGISGRVIPG